MKRLLILSILLLTSCTQISTLENKTLPKPPSSSRTTKSLCIISDLPVGWPLQEQINLWNLNKKNLFVQNQDWPCDGQIEFWLTDSQEFWGETKFLYRNYALIYFNIRTPKEFKSHTLCHELGHVLGLPHSDKPDTCMNIALLDTAVQPSTNDLQEVGKDLWDWEYVSRHATGH